MATPPDTPPINPGTICGFKAALNGLPSASASATGDDRPTLGANWRPTRIAKVKKTVDCRTLKSLTTRGGNGIGFPAVTGKAAINAGISISMTERTPNQPDVHRIANSLVFELMISHLLGRRSGTN